MHRLSIVIPCRLFDQAAEDTLVSVLQNRPVDCEVVVVTAERYDDPYDLSGEVKFVAGGKNAGVTELVNRGVESASAEVVHVLLPGVQALDQWTEMVLEHFEDPQIGAVSPALLSKSTDSRALSLGIGYWACGSRCVIGKGAKLADPRVAQISVLGPCSEAGFYRRSVVSALGGFDEGMDFSHADVELALAMRQLGLQSVVEPASMLVRGKVTSQATAFQRARQAERLFRRYTVPGTGLAVLHVLIAVFDVLFTFPRPQMLTKVFGRIAAWFESEIQARQQERVHRAQAHLARVAVSQSPPSIRCDFSKGRKGTCSKQSRRRAA